MDFWLLFAVFLYFACAVLIVAEIFVPSGGLISICALACLIAGLMIFFKSEIVPSWVGIVVALIEIPIVLIISYKIFPKTAFARNVLLFPPKRDAGDAVADSGELRQMLGKTGSVLTPLRPVGMVDFDGEKYDCVAEEGYVDKGNKVKVIKVHSTQLTVRVDENA